jgi:hypothetical protein
MVELLQFFNNGSSTNLELYDESNINSLSLPENKISTGTGNTVIVLPLG